MYKSLICLKLNFLIFFGNFFYCTSFNIIKNNDHALAHVPHRFHSLKHPLQFCSCSASLPKYKTPPTVLLFRLTESGPDISKNLSKIKIKKLWITHYFHKFYKQKNIYLQNYITIIDFFKFIYINDDRFHVN